VLARGESTNDYMVMTMAVSKQTACHDRATDSGDLLYLRAMATAIEEIKLALVDDIRRATDRTIAIVAPMAAYEALLGDPKVYRTHMQGIVVMVRSRGELVALGMNGLLLRFLLWIDSSISHVTGHHNFLEHTELHPPPSPKQFAYCCYCAIHSLSGMPFPHIDRGED
jgi:hypothetical protein